MGIWQNLCQRVSQMSQTFNFSMASNEKESWETLKARLFALMTNNKEVLEDLKESNLRDIKKILYSALCLCKCTVESVMENRKNQRKKIKDNSLVKQVNECLRRFKMEENFDTSACFVSTDSVPNVEVDLNECCGVLNSLAALKPNSSSGWNKSIKKMMDRFAEISEICYKKEKEQPAEQEQAKQEQTKQEQKKREKEEKINQEYPTELKNFISKYFPELKVTQIDEDRKELISKFAKWFVKIFKQSYLYSRYKYTKFSDLPSKGGRNGYLESLYKGVIVTALIQLSKLTTGDDKKYDLIEYFDKIKNKTPESQTTPHLDLVTKNLNQNKLLNHFMDEVSYLKRRLIKEDYKEEKIKAVTHPSYLEILNCSESELKQEITNSIDEELENSKGDKEQKEDKKNKESKNDEKIVKRKKYKKAKRTKPKPKDHKKTKKVKAKEAPNKNEELNVERKRKAAEQSEEDKRKFRNEKHAKEREELKKFNEKVEKLQKEYEEFYLKLHEEKKGNHKAMRSALESWIKDHNAKDLVKNPSKKKLKDLKEKIEKQNEKENKEENNKSNENNKQKSSEEIINEKPVTKKSKKKPTKKAFSEGSEGDDKEKNKREAKNENNKDNQDKEKNGPGLYINTMGDEDYKKLFEAYEGFLNAKLSHQKNPNQLDVKWPNELGSKSKCKKAFDKLSDKLQQELIKGKVSESDLRKLLKKHDETEYNNLIQKKLNQIKPDKKW